MSHPAGRRFINPPDAWDSTEYGFSQAVVAAPGETIYLSGQVDWDSDRNINRGDLTAQTRGAFASLARVLAAEATAVRR